MNALILENSKLFQTILEEIFQKLGLSIKIACTAEQGLRLLLSNKFDFICVSMHLNDTSGFEFTKRYKAQRRDKPIPIILITSESNESIIKESLKIGITEVYSKANVEKLRKQIAQFVESFKSPQEAFDISNSNVLYIEDSATVAMVTKEYMGKLKINTDHFKSADEAYENIGIKNYDLIITDVLVEGEMSILSFIRYLRMSDGPNKNVPVLAVTSFDDAPRKIELFRAGISDYATKPVMREEFFARVTNLLSNKLLLDQVRLQKQELLTMAMTDPLTGLNNRHSLLQFVPKYISSAKRRKSPLSVMMIDLDHFKSINDNHGHDIGDIVLKEAGALLLKVCRKEDFVARFGGEEFVVLLADCNKEKALSKCENIRLSLEDLRPNNLNISGSIGITCIDSGSDANFDDMFKAADNAVYKSKENGRNQVTFEEVE